MSRTEKVEFTNMCMVCDGNRVLVIDRKKQDWPGVTFPGGHMEPGESFTDAVIREVQEETGLNIRSPQLCGIKDWCEENGLASLTVTCAPCDEGMYQALGFDVRLGSTFAHIV